MKLADFESVCQREWDKLGALGIRGDVTCLRLTDDSWLELNADVISDASHRYGDLAVNYMLKSKKIFSLINPVTRSDVATLPGADSDTAVVSYGPDAATAEVLV